LDNEFNFVVFIWANPAGGYASQSGSGFRHSLPAEKGGRAQTKPQSLLLGVFVVKDHEMLYLKFVE
jgi:hypothetical protein